MMDRAAEAVGELHLGDVLIHWTKSLNWSKLCLMQDLTVMNKVALHHLCSKLILRSGWQMEWSLWPDLSSAELETNLSW